MYIDIDLLGQVQSNMYHMHVLLPQHHMYVHVLLPQQQTLLTSSTPAASSYCIMDPDPEQVICVCHLLTVLHLTRCIL